MGVQRNRLTARRVAAALRRRAAALRGSASRDATKPRLSVVVPVYNVQDYLAECLDSVLGQTLTDLEVIAVDDGSTDGSAAILDQYAARDPRVRVVRRTNGGLGAARNTGLDRAVGEYLTFVDSDDTIPEDAYRVMVETLDASGSDLVVGRIVRLIRGHERNQPWSRHLHARRRLGIEVEELPKILRDLYTPNKVYRRRFWEENAFRFREVGLFEDQPLITDVYCRARRIDVLQEATYRWRIRDDGSSLSQNMLQAPEVRARHEAIRLTREVLEARGSAPLIEAWRWTLVQDHFPHYLTNTTADGFAAATEMLRDVIGDAVAIGRVADCAPASRVLCYLALAEDRDACLDFARVTRTRDWPVVWEDAEAFVEIPRSGASGYPRELVRLDAWQNEMRAWLADCMVREDGTLEVRGRAYLEYVDSAQFDQSVTLIACHDATGTEIEIGTEPDPRAWTGVDSSHGWIDYRNSGFRAEVSLPQLARAVPESPAGDGWRFEVRVEAAGRSDRGRFWGTRHLSVSRMAVLAEVDGRLARASWSADQGLVLSVFAPPVLARSVHVEEHGELSVEARIDPAFVPTSAALLDDDETRRPVGLERLDDQRWRVVIAGSDLSGEGGPSAAGGAWRVVFYSVDSGRRFLLVTDRLCAEVSRGGLGLQHNRLGQAQLRPERDGLLVTAVSAGSDGVSIEGRLTGVDPAQLRLRLANRRTSTDVATVEVLQADPTTVRAVVPYAYEEWGVRHDGVLPLGDFHVEAGPLAVQLAPEAAEPQTLSLPHLRVELIFPRRQNVLVRVSPPLADDELGRVNQRRLVEYAEQLDEPLRDAVLFQCLRGDIVGDSQLAVDRELARTHPQISRIWATVDHTIAVPAGAERVIVRSREWYRAFATARWIVVNHELPQHFVKRRGQVVVQTYHGHPYKLMGLSRWRRAGWSEPRIERALEGARTWDHLVAPSPLAERLYAENFPGPAQILTIGHPRNDVLVGAEAEAIRARTRELLRLGPEEIAVLYAPTWRDYSSADPWKSKLVDFLDPEEFTTLGEGFTLLLRGHPAHQRHEHRARAVGNGRVVDVTDYPEINDLILAADVGLFDYSSIRFDFAVTGKPMLFFVPDDEIYLSSVGTLLDFAESTPGPHSHTFDELREQLLDLDRIRAEYATAYEKFVTTFNPLDDGHAAARLVGAVFDGSESEGVSGR